MLTLNTRTTTHEEQTANDPTLLKRLQLAKAVNVSPRQIDNWQRSKKIPFLKLGPRCVRFHLPSVLAALQRYTIKEVH